MKHIVFTKFNKQWTLHVRLKISKQLRIRVMAATALIYIAAWILGTGIVIKGCQKDEQT